MMYDYAKWMANAGPGACVIAGDVHHDFTANQVREETLAGIRIRRVRVILRHLVRRSLNCVAPSMLLLGYKKVRSVDQVTVIHIAEFRSPVFVYAAVLRRLLPRRVVLVHSAFGMLYSKDSRLRRYFDPVFMRFMLRSVDIGLAQNEHESGAYLDICRRYGQLPQKSSCCLYIRLVQSAPRLPSRRMGVVGATRPVWRSARRVRLHFPRAFASGQGCPSRH